MARRPQRRPTGRRRAAAARPPRRLRTDYTYADQQTGYLFYQQLNEDLAQITARHSEAMRRADRLAVARRFFLIGAVILGVFSVVAASIVASLGMPWWHVPVVQSVATLFVALMLIGSNNGIAERILLGCEARRRGIPFDKHTPLYQLLNMVNTNYNQNHPFSTP